MFFFLPFASFAQQIPAWKITDVEQYINQKNDSVYVVNFWATWCKPCVEELPYLLHISKKYAGKKVKLLLVSLDFAASYPKKIEAFAQKQSITEDIVWLNETDADYFCSRIDKSWSGSIPATVIINSSKSYKQFYEQGISQNEFEKALLKAINNWPMNEPV